jgi:hypothetical protein
MIRGVLMPEAYAKEVAILRAWIEGQEAAHWRDFAAAWKMAP